ncbi:hypothetical protein LTR10_013667 [Elasticomyces elasticus]|uniref:Major facilitator superfamily (MFS) profile domain-containing protein n=1 Tax=Exophiala sideris TaxID=1016849 RepID=A0ABR0JHC0_9EURO|nr:hypothetical protein LTR10_013667 [Elasticomyces elasticus]KAK5033358.1 hypothetical protein LTS07_003660 [Exophiala sideris]KAK5042145.1 hypothetical protein LTR13_001951 [Exophiala sideris]KAK5063902.1 hypothetical protein LTR69_003668 [Exophiala sideris]KAK5185413.1 hypothetical protein LTR44_002402 [Eurotiomycetes sp. CCFEE 6388]
MSSGTTTHQQHSDRHDVELQSTLTDDKCRLGETQLDKHDPQIDEGAASGSSETLGSQLATRNDGALERTLTAQDYPARPEQAQRTVTTASAAGPVHSVFTTNQKRFIVFMASWAGFFSPVSGQIYFPALVPLANDLHVSNSLINLTLTSYMIFQGLAPTFVGDFADAAGRRPAYAANIGLALQDSYAALFVLRCVQSTGSSATIAMCSAVVSDVATAAERGKYMGFTLAGSLLGPAIGPVIGGVLAQFLGWRAIFWFLTIMGATFLIIFAIFFPETARSQVGNGSIPPKGWSMSLMNYMAVRKARKLGQDQQSTEQAQGVSPTNQKTQMRFPNPLRSMALILDKENFLLLFYNAFLFASFYDVTASIPSQFEEIYNFNVLQIGLCYIPFGVGSMCAALVNGQLLDRNFARWCKMLGVKIRKGRNQDLSDFPIERARLQIAIPASYSAAIMVCIFGWIMDVNGPLAAILVVLFFASFSMSIAFNVTSTLLVDFYPTAPATATAANNVVRCLLGAGATAAILPMIEAMGRGWTFTFLTLFLIATSPMLWIVYFRGMTWRGQRNAREKKAREAREEKLRRKSGGESGSPLPEDTVAGREKTPMGGNLPEMVGVVEKEREENQVADKSGETVSKKNDGIYQRVEDEAHEASLYRTLSYHSEY